MSDRLATQPTQLKTLFPVILPIPAPDRILKGRERVLNLSLHARRALEISAHNSGVQMGELAKDKNGAPLPSAGNFWSLTHKPGYAGAVVSPQPVGIDLEEIRPCKKALFDKIAKGSEWDLAATVSDDLFFRYWTGKEAVLKAGGAGLTELSQCRIRKIVDENHLIIHYRGADWRVEHFYFNGHIVSVIQQTACIRWSLVEGV